MTLTALAEIDLYRLKTLIKALSLEMIGMRRSHPPTAYVILKKEYGFTGNREKVYKQAQKHAEQMAGQLEKRLI